MVVWVPFFARLGAPRVEKTQRRRQTQSVWVANDYLVQTTSGRHHGQLARSARSGRLSLPLQSGMP
jgi:hypothetical protein